MRLDYETLSCCDLCGSGEFRVIDGKANIVECKACGLKFVSPRYCQTDISESYDWSYGNCPGWGEVESEAIIRYKRRFDFIDRFARAGNILDIGAGRGEFLHYAKKTGRWQCFGTETSRYAVDFAKKKFDIDLLLGQLEDLRYPDSHFDVVSLWHALEHLPYPSRAIKEANRILRPGGYLFIAVPNDSWLGRRHFFKNAVRKAINHLPLKRKLRLKKMYPGIDEEGNKHLFYFTPHTLGKLLKKHGFQVKRCSVDYAYGNFGHKLERKYRFDVLFCRFTGINLSNAILIAAQKKK
ncbi:MAG: class I SAM-dependent methyltransferase [Candidatus Omnitrophica bacterium]|nr:class I SAM-dependent methyltransferase [Candidatus Omnitrophota bacterium]